MATLHRSMSVPEDASYYAEQEQSRGLMKARSSDCCPALSRMPSSLPRLARTVTNSNLGKAVYRHQRQLPLWIFFGIVALFTFHLFSDGDYSFLMTLGSIISTLSFAVLVLRVLSTGSMQGISIAMMQCYCVLLWMRLSSIMFYDSYLPFDRSGDIIYRAAEVLNCVFSTYLVFIGMFVPKYKQTVASQDDKVNPIYLLGPTMVLGLLFHPSLNGNMLTDIAWAAALYLECVAVVPQLFMFNAQRKVEPSTTHFLAAQALSRVMSFTFWAWTWQELNDTASPHPLKAFVGQWVLIMQAVQLLVMCDFIFNYARAIVKGAKLEEMLLPTFGNRK